MKDDEDKTSQTKTNDTGSKKPLTMAEIIGKVHDALPQKTESEAIKQIEKKYERLDS